MLSLFSQVLHFATPWTSLSVGLSQQEILEQVVRSSVGVMANEHTLLPTRVVYDQRRALLCYLYNTSGCTDVLLVSELLTTLSFPPRYLFFFFFFEDILKHEVLYSLFQLILVPTSRAVKIFVLMISLVSPEALYQILGL